MSHINYNDAKEVSYQYNKVGELVKMDDWLGTTTFEVDLLGQLKKMTDHKGNVVEYTYDAVGNQTSVTYPDETTVTKTYDNTYNLTKVTDTENQNYLYHYDDAGRVTKLTYPNGWVEDYTYDAEGNLLKTVDTDPFHNNKKSTKYEYRYDAEGNLVSEYKRDTTAANRALTTTYTYDALNRLTSAHEKGIGVNTTRTYEYDTLGNMIREEQDGCIEYRYNGYSLDESTKCGTIPNSIGTAYWEYTYDGRGNLISNDKYTRTTSGMDWQNVETYVYDETNRMVQGTNENGEVSIYTYNGLGIRVGRELIVKDNTHGYTDFHSQTPSVETGINKPEVVKESYVIDYTSPTYNTLVMDEEGGFNYRWTYGLDRLNVKITSEGTNWWGQHVTTDILKDYLHQDRLGSTTNLTDTFGRVVGRADYNEWGEMTYREALSITSSYRRIYPQLNYTGYDWDDVLGMYYAKARFYSADDKRFVAMDPIKGSITNPLSLVSYIYCVDNPLRWVDLLGLEAGDLYINGEKIDFCRIDGETYVNLRQLMHTLGGSVTSTAENGPYVDKIVDLDNGEKAIYFKENGTEFKATLGEYSFTFDYTALSGDSVSTIKIINEKGRKAGNANLITVTDRNNPGHINTMIDINKFLNWYFTKFTCEPEIKIEIGDKGIKWERDDSMPFILGWAYAFAGNTTGQYPGIQSITAISRVDAEWYWNNYYKYEYLPFDDTTAGEIGYDILNNLLRRFVAEAEIKSYSRNEKNAFITVSEYLDVDGSWNDIGQYGGIYYTNYSYDYIEKNKDDIYYLTVPYRRTGNRIGVWEELSN